MTNLQQDFITRALAETGYTSRPGNVNAFGERVGYNGLPWAGAFIDVISRDVGLNLISHLYTPTALADYFSKGRLYLSPKVGDIVFLALPTDIDSNNAFTMPHVGIVVDIKGWRSHGMFQTVEANTSTGNVKGSQLNDGVYKRTRHQEEVLGFGRPNFKRASLKVGDNKLITKAPQINIAKLRNGKPSKDIERVQLALAVTTGAKNMERGVWDVKTKAAYAKFQRQIGYAGAISDGTPDVNSFKRLARDTGYFEVAE
jgi:hypothetical protein